MILTHKGKVDFDAALAHLLKHGTMIKQVDNSNAWHTDKQARVLLTKKLIAAKKVVYGVKDAHATAELVVPAGQIIHVGNDGRQYKCRGSIALVTRIYTTRGKKPLKEAHSAFDGSFLYKIGEYAVAPMNQSWQVCAGGMHFFLDMQSVRNY